jgi:hypothetical protein
VKPAKILFAEIENAGLMIDNSWKFMQTDILDAKTNHIYRCETVDQLESNAQLLQLNRTEMFYAIHRWRNFKRHEAWLNLLVESTPLIEVSDQIFNKKIDFIFMTPEGPVEFDLKVTRLPKNVSGDISDQDLAIWLYSNQSRQSRYHLANRFFVVGHPESILYDLEIALSTINDFVLTPKKFRFYIDHPNGEKSRAVVLRPTKI